MRELTVFVGGSVGSDPYSPRTWSGTSRFLMAALSQQNLLDKAVGVELPRTHRYLLMLKNFRPNRGVWRKHFYFDPLYRRALSRAAASISVKSACCLQIGAMFSLPTVFPGRKCFSYHDGNLAQTVASGFGIEGVSRKRIDQALRYEEESARQMSRIFTFSEYLRKSFIDDYRISPDKVVTIGGAVNFDQIPTVAAKDYANKKLLFIGVEFVRKGGPQLLKAFRVIRQLDPKTELNVVGPEQIGDVPEGVVFHGRLSKSDPAQRQQLETLFRECTLYVMPSLYEPFGIAPLEAMCYQMPCLVTDGWAMREYVTPGLNGDLVESGSVEDLVSKLKTMMSDPQSLARMGARARERVLEQYTWDAVVSRIVPHVRPH
jgi:alpha-maltose-1-phosphate synthase